MNLHKNIYKAGIAVIMLAALASCKSTKSITGGEANSRLSAKNIVNAHYSNQPKFRTLRGRVKIDYTNGDDSQGVNVSLRMEKDKVIWMSAPLGVVKAHITPKKVSFYNKLQNEYFDGDFSYLSELLGTELDFEKVQPVVCRWAMQPNTTNINAYRTIFILKLFFTGHVQSGVSIRPVASNSYFLWLLPADLQLQVLSGTTVRVQKFPARPRPNFHHCP